MLGANAFRIAIALIACMPVPHLPYCCHVAPMAYSPQSAAVIRHNQRVLAANAKAKRPQSARVVHNSTPRGGELESSGTHHFEAAAFDKGSCCLMGAQSTLLLLGARHPDSATPP